MSGLTGCDRNASGAVLRSCWGWVGVGRYAFLEVSVSGPHLCGVEHFE